MGCCGLVNFVQIHVVDAAKIDEINILQVICSSVKILNVAFASFGGETLSSDGLMN